MDILLDRILVLETIEKILRIQAFLSKASIRATEPDLKVIGIYQSAIKKILESMKEVIGKLDNNYGALNKDERYSCRRRISDVFTAFYNLHLQLKDINGDWTAPETYIFLKNFFKTADNEDDVSIVLSNNYMFEADDLSRYLKGMLKNCSLIDEMDEIRPTLFLPKIESCNPLNWSILAHEMGHVLKRPLEELITEEEIREITTTVDGIKTLMKWTKEVWCDLVAIKILGPSYLASYTIFSLLLAGDNLSIEASTESHPAHRIRLNIMKSFLDKTNAKIEIRSDYFSIRDMSDFFENLFEERCEYARDNADNSQSSSGFQIGYQKFRDILIKRMDDITHQDVLFVDIDPGKVKLLADRLSDGVLIGSSTQNQNIDEALLKIKDLNKGIENKEMDSDPILKNMDIIYEAVKEQPCHIGEIINAGWLYKCEKIYPKMIDLFFYQNREIDYCYNALGNEIFSLDDKLRKSIETSYIHRLFREE